MRLFEFGEEFVGGGAGGGTEVGEGAFFDFGSKLGDFFDVGGFAAFAAIGNGGEVGAVGLEHELVDRDGGEGVADGLGVFEGGDAGEADEGTHRQDAAHGGGVVHEAMKNAADAANEGLHLRKGVFERAALVDDAVKAELGGDFHLLAEDVGLLLFVTRVVGGGEFGFLAGEVVVIKAGFAEGDDFGVAGKFAERGAEVIGCFEGVGGVPADGGEDGGELFGEFEGAGAAIEVGADGDDSGDAGSGGAFDDLGQFGGESRVIKMGVGVVESWRHRRRENIFCGENVNRREERRQSWLNHHIYFDLTGTSPPHPGPQGDGETTPAV